MVLKRTVIDRHQGGLEQAGMIDNITELRWSARFCAWTDISELRLVWRGFWPVYRREFVFH